MQSILLPGGKKFHTAVFALGSMQLLIGVNGFEVAEIINTAVYTLVWSGLAVFLVAAALGRYFAVRMNRRLQHISDVLVATARGAFDARIQLSTTQDDIGQMALQINSALTKLEAHVNGVKQVSADIAHDLRTPLSRLSILIAELEQRCRASGVAYQEFEQISAQTQQITSIFDALLRLTDIEKGQVRDSFSAVDLRALCADVVDTYLPVCQDNGQTLLFECQDPAPTIQGNHALIFQMLADLIENAVQHCPPDTVIQLGLKGTRLTVADNGPGIPSDEYEKVFQRLYRLDRSRHTPGTGLGLNFVMAIATAHEAQVTLADNHPGLIVAIQFPG